MLRMELRMDAAGGRRSGCGAVAALPPGARLPACHLGCVHRPMAKMGAFASASGRAVATLAEGVAVAAGEGLLAGMIYITGDTHGDFRRVKRYVKENGLAGDDTMIVLGDAGINYFGNSRDEQPRKLIAKLPITVFCIHGNHEMRPATLPMYHEERYRGGTVYAEDAYPNILFAKDGEVYDFDGVETMVIGGAYSVDKERRIEKGWSWFPDEQPSDETKQLVWDRLEERDWKIDVMLSHTCPRGVEPIETFFPDVDQSTVDKSTEDWLQTVAERLDFKWWYFGHFHASKVVGNYQLMFQDIGLFYGQLGWEEPPQTVLEDPGDEQIASGDGAAE